MSRASLVDVVTEELLSRITSGRFTPDAPLPAEADLAVQCGASRLTVREAVKVLAAQNIVRTVQGRGTYVNPPEAWLSLAALMRVQGARPLDAMIQLIEVRAMIEVGAAELFAPRCTTADLTAMAEDVERMQAAHDRADVAAFVSADIAFHGRIIEGTRNPFVPATFRPIARALQDARHQTSEVSEIRRNAIAEHRHILIALETTSARAAGAAMRAHLDQTMNDALRYLRNSQVPSVSASAR